MVQGGEGLTFSLMPQAGQAQDSRYESGQQGAHSLPEEHGHVHSDGRTSLEASRDSQQVSQHAAEQVSTNIFTNLPK